MPAKSDPRVQHAGSEYYYRRALSASASLPAVGVGVGVGVAAGLVAFYLTHLYLERTPLVPEPDHRDPVLRHRTTAPRARDG